MNFGLHGLGKIMSAIHDANLGSALGEHLAKAENSEPDHHFVKINRESLAGIKTFVNTKPELAGLAKEINDCDCPPYDPGCVYIPG